MKDTNINDQNSEKEQNQFELLKIKASEILQNASVKDDSYILMLENILNQFILLDTSHTENSEKKFKALFSNIPIGIFRTTSKGKPVHINPAMAKILGFASSEEAIEYYDDLSLQLYVKPQRRKEFIQTIREKGEVTNFKYEAKRVDGKIIWLTMNAKIGASINNGDFFIDGFTLDITRQIATDQKLFELNNELIDQNIEYFKLNEELQKSIAKIQLINLDLERAKNKAEESDRLKSSFLANLSHEIRTPLNSIMGFASLLPEEESKPVITKYANIIFNSSEQLVHIIDDIVLYSKLQTKMIAFKQVKFEVFKLLQIIQQSFDLPIYNKSVKLLVDNLSKNVLYANTDYDIMRQIITNLVSNSFKYTLSGEIHIGCTVRDKSLVFYVKDTGIGIPKEEYSLIFDRFYRGSNVNEIQNGGTGLGLSIVAELVQLVNGKINVESTVGVGTTFEIIVPQ